ncbi:uncharacterized mitochondrial protein-like protein [Tanacetum coccineum]
MDGVVMPKRSRKILYDDGGGGANFGSNEAKEERVLKSCEMKGYACMGKKKGMMVFIEKRVIQSSSKKEQVNWHFARDELQVHNTIKVSLGMEDNTFVRWPILPNELTNEAIKDSESYKEYYAIASGAEPSKTKASVKKKQARSDKAPKAPKGKRLKATSKVTKPSKKKLPDQGLETLSEVSLTEEEQMRIVTKRSLTQFHSCHASRSGVNEGTGVTPGVPDQISWKSSDEEDEDDEANIGKDKDDDDQDNDDDQGDEDERIDSDNNGDDFVYPKFSTDDEEGANVEGDEQDEEETNEETNVQPTQVTEYIHVIITSLVNPEGQQQSSSVSSGFVSNMLNPSSDTGIDSIFNLNTESTYLVDVSVTAIAEPPLLSVTTTPPPPTPLITHLQQTPVPTPPTVPSSSLQDLPNFGSLFGFDHRLKTLENNFSEFNQTNQFAALVSLIPGIVDALLANKMHEAIKTVVQLQSERLRDEAQDKNADFINKLDDNIKKIIKNQVKEQVKAQVSKILPKIEKTVNEKLEDEVLTRSSNKSKTSHVVAANLSELELKKILIDKMESNKSIYRSDEQKNLYKALVDAYESDKLILDTYGDTVSFKRRRDDEDKDEEPSAGSNRGSKRRRAGKEPESTSAPKEKTSKTTGKSTEGSKSHHKSAGESAQAEEPMHTAKDLEEPAHQEFEIGVTEDQPNKETSQLPDWFQKPAKPPTPDRDWNKTLPEAHGPVQPWLSSLAQMEDPRESFNELMDTPLDFSAFVMNRLKVDTLTPELLAGPTFELMKGSCKSLVELEYFLEEVYKATTDQLDWINPEGQQYPHDLRKPLPLIPNSRGLQVIPFDHFINNDLEYLSECGVKCRESARDVYSKRIIIAVTKLQIVEWHGYKHLDWITIRRDDDKLYTFKEGDFKRLLFQDIEDMLILLI